jgi:NADH dehydrogenase [ubiquinone] 1 alpha subcomplex assembly factor 3
MHAPSSLLLRALRGNAPRQHVCRQLTNHYTTIHSGLRNTFRTCKSVRFLSGGRALTRDQTTGPPKTRDRGPKSTEDTQTDFGAMNILGNMGTPATSIDACVSDGFHLNNGLKTSDGSGMLLVGGEAFLWRPWQGTPDKKPAAMLSKAGTLEIGGSGGAWGLLELLWPKPDLLIVGTGGKTWLLSKETREFINGLGVKIDVMDTGHASAAYNLLATERGMDSVAAAMLPIGWNGR